MTLENIKKTAPFPGEISCDPAGLSGKLKNIKLLAFDWDGIFNDGKKGEVPSSFNEIDSMGVNMLRYGFYLVNHENPPAVIITGEKNDTAIQWARREHFHAVYQRVKNKADVIPDLGQNFTINPKEILFVFDDIHDLSLARKAGVRIMVRNPGNPLLIEYCREHGYFDYLTENRGGHFALREISEVMLSLLGQFENTVSGRIEFNGTYRDYWKERNRVESTVTDLPH